MKELFTAEHLNGLDDSETSQPLGEVSIMEQVPSGPERA